MIYRISIHTLHTEGDFLAAKTSQQLWISIHTLHTEGDVPRVLFWVHTAISIHTLHTEGDPQKARRIWQNTAFQSTPSTRRVTDRSAGVV